MKNLRSYKGLSLRIVNIAGLATVFASLLLSVTYIRNESSYDRHNSKAERTVRLSLHRDGENMDVRVHGNKIYSVLSGFPEIEAVARLRKSDLPSADIGGKSLFIPGGALEVNREFFDVFDIFSTDSYRLSPDSDGAVAYISESYARFIQGETGTDPQEINMISNSDYGTSYPVGGIFRDLPKTAHFHADILICDPEVFENDKFTYVYLLLKGGTDIKELSERLTPYLKDVDYMGRESEAFMMPLTDIHLHSHFDRELEGNGSIIYIYMLICANVLLLAVALSNLLLNQRVILADNDKSWRIRRVLGASAIRLAGKEMAVSAAMAGIAIIAALAILYAFGRKAGVYWEIPGGHVAILAALFILTTSAVSAVPALRTGKVTAYGKIGKSARLILSAQYAISIFILVLAIGMGRQMKLVSGIQPGGDGSSVIVMELPAYSSAVRYSLFRDELLKRPSITGVTSAMQLPGEAVIDGADFFRGDFSDDGIRLPLMVVGEGFLPFFDITVAAGKDFSPLARSYEDEVVLFRRKMMYNEISPLEEEYVINRSAASALGFSNPEEAVGAKLMMKQGTVDFICKGTVAAVTDDFRYTGTFSGDIPLVMLQRNLFAKKVMIGIDPDNPSEALASVKDVWEELFPGSSFDGGYAFLSDEFNETYSNEIYAARMMSVFVLLCLAITLFGLTVFIAYIVQRRKKEIAIRKVQGATSGDILVMINLYYMKYVAIAFIVAAPAAWYVLRIWLERFAYRAEPDWSIFVIAAASVMLISVAAVSIRSRKAASANPLEGIRDSL